MCASEGLRHSRINGIPVEAGRLGLMFSELPQNNAGLAIPNAKGLWPGVGCGAKATPKWSSQRQYLLRVPVSQETIGRCLPHLSLEYRLALRAVAPVSGRLVSMLPVGSV